MKLSAAKQKFLDTFIESSGWRYILLEEHDLDVIADDEPPLYIHELYGDKNGISWTENSVELSGGKEFVSAICKEIVEMIDDNVVFVEDDLWQFNIDLVTDKQKLADYLTNESESVRLMAEQKYKELFSDE